MQNQNFKYIFILHFVHQNIIKPAVTDRKYLTLVLSPNTGYVITLTLTIDQRFCTRVVSLSEGLKEKLPVIKTTIGQL